MKKLICFYIVISLSFFAEKSYAQEKPEQVSLKLLTGFYTVSEYRDLQSILKNEFKIKEINLKQKNKLIKDLKHWNRHILNWNGISEGSEIYIEILKEWVSEQLFVDRTYLIPKQFHILTKSESFIASSTKSPAPFSLIPNTKEEVLPTQEKTKFSFFVTMSYGTFNETFSTPNSNATSTQNSPLTIGASILKKINSDWSIYSSLYFSYLIAGRVDAPNVQNKTVDIPPEIGHTLSIQRDLKYNFFTSAGLDYERFTTLNIDAISRGTSNTLQTKNQQIIFASLGLMKLFPIGQKNIVLRLTAAQSTWSKSENNTDSYSGQKYMFQSLYKFHSHWSTHTFAKLLDLSGPSELSVWRFGVGFNYHL